MIWIHLMFVPIATSSYLSSHLIDEHALGYRQEYNPLCYSTCQDKQFRCLKYYRCCVCDHCKDAFECMDDEGGDDICENGVCHRKCDPSQGCCKCIDLCGDSDECACETSAGKCNWNCTYTAADGEILEVTGCTNKDIAMPNTYWCCTKEGNFNGYDDLKEKNAIGYCPKTCHKLK